MTAMPKQKEGPLTMTPRFPVMVLLLLSASLLPAQALKVSYVPTPAAPRPPAGKSG